MEITPPARKHGIADDDIRHAAQHALRMVTGDDGFVMLLGPALDGRILEIGILDDEYVIHAMPIRRKFYRYL